MNLLVSWWKARAIGAFSRLNTTEQPIPIFVQAQILRQGFQTSGLDTFCPHEQMNLSLQCQEKALPLNRHL